MSQMQTTPEMPRGNRWQQSKTVQSVIERSHYPVIEGRFQTYTQLVCCIYLRAISGDLSNMDFMISHLLFDCLIALCADVSIPDHQVIWGTLNGNDDQRQDSNVCVLGACEETGICGSTWQDAPHDARSQGEGPYGFHIGLIADEVFCCPIHAPQEFLSYDALCMLQMPQVFASLQGVRPERELGVWSEETRSSGGSVALCMLFPFVDLVLKGLESALETSESVAYSPGVTWCILVYWTQDWKLLCKSELGKLEPLQKKWTSAEAA